MSGPLAGVRVLEVATHVFAPMAGAVLAEWGAEVVKVEALDGGDPYRGLVTSGLHPLVDGADPYVQAANRSKRSVGLDLKHPEGRMLLGRLLGASDVFVTSLRGFLEKHGRDFSAALSGKPRKRNVETTATGLAKSATTSKRSLSSRASSCCSSRSTSRSPPA